MVFTRKMGEWPWRHFEDFQGCHSQHMPRMPGPWGQNNFKGWAQDAHETQVSLPRVASSSCFIHSGTVHLNCSRYDLSYHYTGHKGKPWKHAHGANSAGMQSIQAEEVWLLPPRFQRMFGKALSPRQRTVTRAGLLQIFSDKQSLVELKKWVSAKSLYFSNAQQSYEVEDTRERPHCGNAKGTHGSRVTLKTPDM